ncbi:Lrp/AsnC family transcriptional regulator [Desulfogranum japonicum]|uniref:Lrp/AsnC family transcriptional regulator n=1 Tax=Desulfogranum japonicum TaxID=231447 RepID=UPI0004225A03|nr:Lrp/AsnC family transcriptional regulator [Desulfogranum japonicum]
MIDDVSLKILEILQEKARIPNVEVARQMDMAPSAVLERIRKLERQGIIDGYEVRLNPDQFNRRLIAFVTVNVCEQKAKQPLGPYFAALREIQEVHYVSGKDCYLLKVRVADNGDLYRFLQEKIILMAGVIHTQTTQVLHTFKETAKLPLTNSTVEQRN